MNIENNKNPGQQPLPLTIAATVDEASFLQNLVEKLAHRRTDPGYGTQVLPCGLMALETSSLEAHISGSMDISAQGDNFRIPYTTCFFFTCIKEQKEEYSLSWVSSLS